MTRPLPSQAELDDFLRIRPGAVPLLRGGPFVVRGNVAVEVEGDSEVMLEGATATLYERARAVVAGGRITLFDQARADVWHGDVEAWDDAHVTLRQGRAAVTDRVSVVVRKHEAIARAPLVIASGQARVAAYAAAWIRLHQAAALAYAPSGSIVELGTNARFGHVGRGCVVMPLDESGPLEEELATLAVVRALLS